MNDIKKIKDRLDGIVSFTTYPDIDGTEIRALLKMSSSQHIRNEAVTFNPEGVEAHIKNALFDNIKNYFYGDVEDFLVDLIFYIMEERHNLASRREYCLSYSLEEIEKRINEFLSNEEDE
jgi:predicted mannosyl-3-phosphoglycerate phosphatase (HAD superfamily)